MNAKTISERLPGPFRGRPAVAAAAGVLLLLLLWAVFGRSKAGDAPTSFYEVKRGDFTVSVVEGGTLAAVNEVIVRSDVEGTARVIYIAKEGSYVKKGDLLVELDSAQAQDQVNQQRISAEKATNALTTAQLTLDIQRSQTNSDISAAQLKLDLAKLDLRKFELGGRAVSLLEATNSLLTAEASLKVNEEKYRNSTNLFAKNYETKQTVDSDRVALLNSTVSMVKATNSLFILQEFDLKKQQATYEAAVEEAEKELNRVLQQSDRRIAQFESDLITQSNTLVLNQRKLERDEKNLTACKILAPQDGLVVYSVSENRFSSESLIEEGATVRNRQELVKLPNTSRMKVTVKIHESNINLIRIGQAALVVLDSMPEQPFRAMVEKVGLLPDSQSRFGNPNLKVYNTEVVITDPLPDVKPGVSAKAEIIITNIANAISVPIQAVTTLKGRQVAYVLKGGRSEPRPVEAGLFSTKFIQILSGLEPGDRVLLSPPLDTGSRDLEGSVLADSDKARKMATNMPAVAVTQPAAAVNGGMGDGAGGEGRGNRGPGRDGGAGGPGGAGLAGGNGGPGGAPGAGGGAPGGFDREAMMKQMLQQFDKNGDGKLDEEEQAAAREQGRQRFGQGGGGRAGGAGGAGGMRGQMPNAEEMLKRFDKNGDGEIDEQEREAMRAEFGRNRNRTNAPPREPAGAP
jgi:HlyD family secretion protein